MHLALSIAVLSVLIVTTNSPAQVAPPVAHFHHIHINAADPDASIAFYTSRFDCEKAAGPDGNAAMHAGNSWIFFNRVAAQPPSEILSAIWHIGWGAEDMPAAYRKTDIGDLVGMAKGKFFFAYVDGPDHGLIELNTASHHHFGHLHLLSADPIAAAEWYHEQLGLPIAGRQPQKRIYNGLQVSPSASLQADDVRIIIFPLEYARGQWPAAWQARKDFEPTAGRVIDHIAFTREGAKPGFIEGPDHIKIELVAAH